jgi:outer membrane immunogenic protein
VQLGYNWQFNSVVAGLEADIQDIAKGSNSGTLGTVVGPFPFALANEVVSTTISSTKQVDYLGTVRGRLGILASPSVLLYGSGGLAYGRVKAGTSIVQSNNDCAQFPGGCLQTTAATAGSVSSTRAGWTIGGGAEWMFWQNWSAKLEYFYYDLGSVTFPVGPLVVGNGTFTGAGGPAVVAAQSTTRFNGNIFRVGLNYKFGGPIYAGN